LRLVVDTNVLVSAFLWQGTPGRLIDLASEKIVQLLTSRALIAEFTQVLHRPRLAKSVTDTGLTAAQMIRNFRRLATVVAAKPLAQPVFRDVDDDAVLACALATHADLIVSGDEDLLSLTRYQSINIVTPARTLQIIESA
jgi:uncharacterized protein